MKTKAKNQTLFDLHLEYMEKAALREKECRTLEGKFGLAFGYLPVHIDDETFPYLTENQQEACIAFWNNKLVREAREAMLTARTLAKTYLDAYEVRGQ